MARIALPAYITEHKLFTLAQRHWLSLAFLLGFITDNITLNQVDQLFDNLVLLMYVLLSATALLLLYAGSAGKLGERWSSRARQYAPLLIQFTFGGLLSGMLIFYGRSGAWVESWPFLAIIVAAIYFNETIKDRTSRLIYNIAIFFIGLFSYVVLVIPVLTGHMGPWVFVGSGLIALMLMYIFMQGLYRIIPHFLDIQMRFLVFTIGCVFFGFNFFYFANIIPPIPLSLKEVGIFHSVARFENGTYALTYEDGRWWQPFKDSDTEFHPTPGGSVFCFARVFAPTRLKTDIVHNIERYDVVKREWVSVSRTGYEITGGNSRGYRGYTLTNNYEDGDWRCTIETERGQVLGRENFTIDSTKPPSDLVERVE